MRALVTGGAGFIGSALVDRLLAEGHEVDVLDDLSTGSLANLAEARRAAAGSLKFHQVDLRAPEIVELIGMRRPEVLFHLGSRAGAVSSFADPVTDAEANVIATLRVLEGARLAGTNKVVYSTRAGDLYGEVDSAELPIAERALPTARSPHGVAKKAVLDYLHLYREQYGLEFTTLVLGHVYGPRQRADADGGVVATFARNLIERRPCLIYGDGTQTRDYVFVDDVVDAFARAARRGGGLLLNIGWGIEVTVNALYTEMASQVGRRAAAQRRRSRPGDLTRMSLDASRARLHLDWKPWTPLREGVARTLEAIAENVSIAVRAKATR